MRRAGGGERPASARPARPAPGGASCGPHAAVLSPGGAKGPASRASGLGDGEHGPGILPMVTAPALAPAGGAAGDARAAGEMRGRMRSLRGQVGGAQGRLALPRAEVAPSQPLASGNFPALGSRQSPPQTPRLRDVPTWEGAEVTQHPAPPAAGGAGGENSSGRGHWLHCRVPPCNVWDPSCLGKYGQLQGPLRKAPIRPVCWTDKSPLPMAQVQNRWDK